VSAVSAEPKRVRAFFEDLRERSRPAGGFMAILEVCGFNDWLLRLLKEYECREIVLIHAGQPGKRKTDRRDSNALGDLLWMNRERLKNGQRPRGLRRVAVPSEANQADRQLTAVRQRAGQQRARVMNRVKHLLLKHNLQWNCPTKGLATQAAMTWLWDLPLGEIDRLELNQLLERWNQLDVQIAALDAKIVMRAEQDPLVARLRSCPGVSHYSGLALASRIGSIERFPHPRSLGNYWGLTPGCRNSGNVTNRLGSITKEGSRIARFILSQLTLHVLKKDPQMRRWYQGIKRRRGSKIARVAVMRRLTAILWHMLKHQEAYCFGSRRQRKQPASPELSSVRS
jgi:transposase